MLIFDDMLLCAGARGVALEPLTIIKRDTSKSIQCTSKSYSVVCLCTRHLPSCRRLMKHALVDKPDSTMKAAKKTPSCMRSKEEVKVVAYKADALCMLSALRDILLRGDAMHSSDSLFKLGGQLVVYEHDPGYWHGEWRIDGDLKKTNLLLQSDANLLVVRGRIDAPRLLIEDP
eukprot:3038824-Prymnesium_polylepis.1